MTCKDDATEARSPSLAGDATTSQAAPTTMKTQIQILIATAKLTGAIIKFSALALWVKLRGGTIPKD